MTFYNASEKAVTLPTLDIESLRLSKQFLITHIKESSIHSLECQLIEQFLCSDNSFSVIVFFALFRLHIALFILWCDLK